MAALDTDVQPARYETRRHPLEAVASGVAWSAILGGAFAAVALSVVLLALGSGFGLATVSPWLGAGASATTFSIMTGLWLIITQWLASGLGGYITGRLRIKWAGLHTHEVFFRDTANGFLTWARQYELLCQHPFPVKRGRGMLDNSGLLAAAIA